MELLLRYILPHYKVARDWERRGEAIPPFVPIIGLLLTPFSQPNLALSFSHRITVSEPTKRQQE